MTQIKSDPRVHNKLRVVAEVEKVRARNEDGSFIGDDPSTPENEAWVEKSKPKEKPKAK
jgi:hypothetical protein|tara:strand:- start:691 stop:867 length:177 start_codon:yes stop_codon:yes gene_type:complete